MNPRAKRVLKGAALAGVAAASLLLVASAILNVRADSVLVADYRRLRAAGQPMSPADCAPPAISAEVNGAALLLGVLDALKSEDDLQRLVSIGERVEDPASLRMIAVRNARALGLIRQALERPRWRFDVDYRMGYDGLLPHLTLIQQGARLFIAEAADRDGRDDAAGATDSLLDLFQLGETLAEEPIFVSQLVRASILNHSLQALSGRPLTPAQAGRLNRLLEPAAGRAVLDQAVTLEIASGMLVFNRLSAGEDVAGLDPGWVAAWPFRPWLKDEFHLYLAAMEEFRALMGRPYHFSKGAAAGLEARVIGKARVKLSSILMPGLLRTMETFARLEAAVDLARLSLVAPGGGATAVANSKDPFSGTSYHVRADGAAFRFWSVGPDGVDNGGDPAKDIVRLHRN